MIEVNDQGHRTSNGSTLYDSPKTTKSAKSSKKRGPFPRHNTTQYGELVDCIFKHWCHAYWPVSRQGLHFFSFFLLFLNLQTDPKTTRQFFPSYLHNLEFLVVMATTDEKNTFFLERTLLLSVKSCVSIFCCWYQVRREISAKESLNCVLSGF